MRICQNFWRPYKGFNLENVTKNNGPMSNFVMKTIGSVEMTMFQKRECWLWRLLLFLKRIHLEFLPRQMTTFLARGQRFRTDSCWSTTYQWCTLGALICASKPEKKRKDCFRSYLLLFSLSLSLFLIAVFREVQLIYERLLVIAELSRAQRSTMGEKIWLSIMHSINFGSEKIVRTSVRTSTPSCKPGWNFAFQVTVRFGGKLHCHPDF